MEVALITEKDLRRIIREELEAVLANQSAIRNVPDGIPVVLKVADAAKLLGMNRDKVYELTKQAGFPVVKNGNRILIPRDPLLKWIEQEAYAKDF